MIKRQCIFKLLVFPFRCIASYHSSSWLIYLFFGSFIIGWWILAFRTTPTPFPISIDPFQSLALKTSDLLEELSPLQRETLQRALGGDFSLMLQYIDQWNQDANFLVNKGVKGIQRLSAESYLQAHVLGNLLENCSRESLHQLNCKMNIKRICDDMGRQLCIEDTFRYFLPQTYISASFLLAIAHPSEIIALPRGLRHFTQLYSLELLDQIPHDIDKLCSEQLYLKKPDLAFVATYSHPPALEVLLNQNIQLYTLKHLNTVEDIQDGLLKIGHASNHILEAQLLAIFVEAGFLSLDNRLLALQDNADNSQATHRLLYLSHHQHYAMPTTKSLTGQLMARALTHCTHLSGLIPESQEEWSIPFDQEQIVQAAPDSMIISVPCAQSLSMIDAALLSTKAFRSKNIYYIDETVQESPTQYLVLAYFDLFQALAATYSS